MHAGTNSDDDNNGNYIKIIVMLVISDQQKVIKGTNIKNNNSIYNNIEIKQDII